MLSGQVPFQRSGSPSNTAANIMNRIKMGDFKFEGQQWLAVSQQARELIQGTVYELAKFSSHEILIYFHVEYDIRINEKAFIPGE